MALGIAANTAIFAIVDELNFKPLRLPKVQEVYWVGVENLQTRNRQFVQIPDFMTWLAEPQQGVAAISAVSYGSALIQIPGRATFAAGRRVSPGYAAVYRINMALGRWIEETDNTTEHGASIVVISHHLWRNWFDASPDVLTHGTLYVRSGIPDRRPYQIVGVAPAGFGDGTDVWFPIGRPRLLTSEELARSHQKVQPGVNVVVRTTTGSDPARVAERLTAAISARAATATPDSPTGSVRLELARSRNELLAGTGYTILGFSALIFLAACANLSNMLLARATDREGELAVRLSLGATRLEVFRALMTEAAIVCMTASALGLGLGILALRLFTTAFPSLELDYWRRVSLELTPDWRMFVLAAGAGAAAAIFVGLASLWRSSRVSLSTRLASAGPSVVARSEGRTLRTLFVSVQITAAVLLLIAAGMFLENAGKRLDTRLLFNTSGLLAARVELPPEYDQSRGTRFFDQVLARVRTLDGVEVAGLTDALPGGSAPFPRSANGGLKAEPPKLSASGIRRFDAAWAFVSPSFTDTIGLRLIRGRNLLGTDEAGSLPVAVLSETAADGLWPGEDPLGKRIMCCRAAESLTVVGVVSDPVRSSDQTAVTGPGTFVFLPASQHFTRAMLVVLRSRDPMGQVDALRQAIVAQDDSVPIFDVAPVDHTQFAQDASERAARLLARALGGIAFGIAVLGIYAVVSYFAIRRRREFGLRLAVGSTRGQIIKLVVDHAIHMVLIGLVPGVLLASWGTHVFQEDLVRFQSTSLVPWISVPLLILVTGILAAYVPARRAARVDPNRALKEN